MPNYQIPFDIHGNQQYYPERSYKYQGEGQYPAYADPKWVDNFEFEDQLQLTDWCPDYYVFTRRDGTKVLMMPTHFFDMLQRSTMSRGYAYGKFTFVKRGQNYGIKYLG